MGGDSLPYPLESIRDFSERVRAPTRVAPKSKADAFDFGGTSVYCRNLGTLRMFC